MAALVDTSDRTGLRVMSAWDPGASLSSDGAFRATVSAGGAQAVLVQDSDGNTRALGISLPGVVPLQIDARSTALGRRPGRAVATAPAVGLPRFGAWSPPPPELATRRIREKTLVGLSLMSVANIESRSMASTRIKPRTSIAGLDRRGGRV